MVETGDWNAADVVVVQSAVHKKKRKREKEREMEEMIRSQIPGSC